MKYTHIIAAIALLVLSACGGGGSSSEGSGSGNTDGALNGNYSGAQNVTLSVGGSSSSTGNLQINFTVVGPKITLSAGSTGGEGSIYSNNKFKVPVRFTSNISGIGVCTYNFVYNGEFTPDRNITGSIGGNVECPNAAKVDVSGVFTANKGSGKTLSGSLEEETATLLRNLLQ
ncbi:MAG: hypothetical protein ACRBHB_17825 [Arenicella sp.]